MAHSNGHDIKLSKLSVLTINEELLLIIATFIMLLNFNYIL